ncbi:TPA: hypothetical protein ACSK94_002965, partial [Listeria innocua]|nr:hypothetical protein [Listeria monocytogenes]
KIFISFYQILYRSKLIVRKNDSLQKKKLVVLCKQQVNKKGIAHALTKMHFNVFDQKHIKKTKPYKLLI